MSTCPICDALRITRVHAEHSDAEPVDARWPSVLERQLARDQAEIERLREALRQASLELVTDVDPDAIVAGIEAALAQSEPAIVPLSDAEAKRLRTDIRQLRDDLPSQRGYSDSIGRFVRDRIGALVELDPVIDALNAALAAEGGPA